MTKQPSNAFQYQTCTFQYHSIHHPIFKIPDCLTKYKGTWDLLSTEIKLEWERPEYKVHVRYLPTTSSLTSFQMRSISGLCSCMMVMASLLCIPWWSMNSPAHGWLSLWSTTQGTYLQIMEQKFRLHGKTIYVKRGRSGGTESITVELWGLN